MGIKLGEIMITRVLAYVVLFVPFFCMASPPQWVLDYQTGDSKKQIETKTSFLYRTSIVAYGDQDKSKTCYAAYAMAIEEFKVAYPWGEEVPKVVQLTYYDEPNKECYVTLEVQKAALYQFQKNFYSIQRVHSLMSENAELKNLISKCRK